MPPTPAPLPRNRNVQWLRAAAALMVLLYHASHYLAAERGDGSMAAIFGGEFGLLGVAIFFAISGALMAEILPRTAPPLFLLHRIARLYPAFLVASLLLPPFLTGRLSIDLRALSLVPVGDNGSYRLRVEWTLIFELFYYMALTGLAALGGARLLRLFALGWLAVILAAAAWLPELRQATLVPTIVDLPFLAANAAFAGGLLVPELVRRGVFQPALGAVAAGLAMLLLGFGFTAGRLLASLVGVILVGLALSAAPRAGPDGWIARGATRLGDWSYALYLCHVPVVLVVMRSFEAPPLALWFAAVALSLLVSVPLGLLDLAIYRRLRARLDAARPQALARGAGIYAAVYVAVAAVFLFKT
ncbi:acyltransferase [Aureimonas sp. AU4]|uniref:acyltransferase family protein n=1 Tax=Aureimonas sp. AU4 TaxID=1638163 RepID=UPI000782F670|nr:acyltransferase [Aureimonas sp. AU4]